MDATEYICWLTMMDYQEPFLENNLHINDNVDMDKLLANLQDELFHKLNINLDIKTIIELIFDTYGQ